MAQGLLLPTSLASPTSANEAAGVIRWHAVAIGLLVLNALWRFAYLIHGPLELAPDEAHYWDWSRQLDWCYYSKGPLVAWLIAASVELFGPWSLRTVGTEILAIRLPAVGCQLAMLSGLYLLAWRVLGDVRLAVATVGIALTLPVVAAVGTLMTIDAPFLACWMGACVFVHSALARNGGNSAWFAAGVVTAIGILAKYTMLAFPVCVAAFLLTSPTRTDWKRRGFWAFLGLSALGLIPILYWNVAHDGIGLRHLLAHANGPANKPKPLVNILGPLEYVGTQFAVLVGFWFLAFLGLAWQWRWGRERSESVRLLWWLAVPLWCFFAVVTLRAKGQPNWPAPAYLPGLILIVAWLRERFTTTSLRHRVWMARGIAGSVSVSVAVTALAHDPHLWRPILAACLPSPTPERPTPIRQLDPTCRLAGWKELARAVDRLRVELRNETGEEPILAGMVWNIPGELAFYAEGHPTVYSLAVVIGERHSQYDIWRPNPVNDAQAFRGRTFLYVGERMPEMEQAFGRVDPPVEVLASDGGIPVAKWKLWVCRDYRGFPPPTTVKDF